MKLGITTRGINRGYNTMTDNNNKLRNRQESTDSLDSSSQTVEEYSSDDDDDSKDELSINDFQIIKTVGKCLLIQSLMKKTKIILPILV